MRRLSLAAALGLGAAVLAYVVGLRPLDDNSFLTHLATGRLILDGGVPSVDPYSVTAAGEPWVVQSWLASTLYALVERAGGGTGLLLLNGGLHAVLGALVWRLSRPARLLLPRVLLSGTVLAIGTVTWSERPLVMALILLCLLCLLLERGQPLLGLPLLWAWAQVHGSWPIGLVVVAVALGGRLIDDRRIDAREARLALAVGAGVLLAPLGPLGLDAWTFPLELLGRQDVLRYVTEWRPPTFVPAWQRLHLVTAFVAVAGAVRSGRWRDRLLVLLAIGLSLQALRNISVAGPLLLLGGAPGSASLLPVRLAGDRRTSGGTALAAAMAAVFVTATAVAVDRAPYDLSGYPVALLAWSEQRELGQPDAYEMRIGNLLEAMDEHAPAVYIDDRVDMYPKAHVLDFVRLADGQSGWDDVLDELDAGVVLWRTGGPLAELFRSDPRWQVRAGDERWLVAVRRTR